MNWLCIISQDRGGVKQSGRALLNELVVYN